MVFKPTSTDRSGRRGFTLVETVVSIGIGMIVLAAVATMVSYTGRSFASLVNYVELDRKSRNALDVMTRDIRQTAQLSSFATNRLVFTDWDAGTLTYAYDSGNRTLTKTKGGTNTVLLTECDTLAFNIFQRNPIGGTYDQYSTATVTNAKLVQVTWTCSRQIMATRVNTESVQTAKIVIRKQ